MINYTILDFICCFGVGLLSGIFIGAWLASGLSIIDYLKKYY